MKWIKIDSDRVKNIWTCENSSCKSFTEEIAIHPDWYEDNGTPTCECGDDMCYSRTEVELVEP